MALQRQVIKTYPFKDYTQNGSLSLKEAKKAAEDAAVRDQVTTFLGKWTDYKITSEEVILYGYYNKE